MRLIIKEPGTIKIVLVPARAKVTEKGFFIIGFFTLSLDF
jgi:hypothetical protein